MVYGRGLVHVRILALAKTWWQRGGGEILCEAEHGWVCMWGRGKEGSEVAERGF